MMSAVNQVKEGRGLRPGARKGRNTKMRRVFAQKFVELDGNATAAMRETRKIVHPERVYSRSAAGPASVAMMKEPAVRAMIQSIETRLTSEAEKSVVKLAELRDGSANEKIQVDTSSKLIDSYLTVTKYLRQPDEAKTVNNILVTNMSNEDILRRIEQLKTAGEPGAGGPVPGAGEAPLQV